MSTHGRLWLTFGRPTETQRNGVALRKAPVRRCPRVDARQPHDHKDHHREDEVQCQADEAQVNDGRVRRGLEGVRGEGFTKVCPHTEDDHEGRDFGEVQYAADTRHGAGEAILEREADNLFGGSLALP
jgi:hypothetical protein